MPAERQFAVLNDFSAGAFKDRIDVQDPPIWRTLDNLWLNDGILQSRPFLDTHISEASGNGLAKTHDNKLVAVANNKVYIDGVFEGTINGTDEVSYGISKDVTAFCNGDDVKTWDGTTFSTLTHSNVKSLAIAHGFSGKRLFFVKSTELRTVYYTAPGNFNDTGTTITDANNYDDEKTEGGRLKGFSSDIIDVQEFGGSVVVFCKAGIFTINSDRVGEFGWYPAVSKTREQEIWDVKPKRYQTGILFLTPQGLNIYSIGETGPFTQLLSVAGNKDTIRNQLTESEARIGIDRNRNLFFLQTASDENIWVYHAGVEGMPKTQWDTNFEDILDVDGETYLIDSSSVKIFDDDGDGTLSYTITIRSGLTWLGQVKSRKRLRRLGANISYTRDIEWYLDAYKDAVVDESFSRALKSVTSTVNNDIAKTDEIETRVGIPCEATSILASFTNKGKFNLNNFWISFMDKGFRGSSN